MNERVFLLPIILLTLMPAAGMGQPLPFAEILTADSAWCRQSNNLTVAEILITGDIDTSRFDLVVGIRGSRDTLVNLPSGLFNLYLNNQPGRNEYIIYKIIEYQEYNTLENDLFDTVVMEVNPWPVMNYSAGYESRCSPANVEFTAAEGYPGYTWDFGDGTMETTVTNWTSHTYESQDFTEEINFETGLKIETEAGCVDSAGGSVTIYPTPAAGFLVAPELLFYPETTVSITNNTSAGEWAFQWDFGDGSINLNRDPGQHIYASWGLYNIEMEWSSTMCQGSITKQVDIRPPAPEAAFLPDTSGCPPLEVSFNSTSLYADTYRWDFEDGASSTGQHPFHSFAESGTYHVKLVVTNLTGKDSITQIITVFDPPEVLFEAGITETNNPLELFSFMNNTINGVTYLWDFGDGDISADVNPEHIYGQPGSYTVTLYAWSINECADTLVREELVTIHEGEGSVSFPNAFKWNGTGPTGGHWSEGSVDNTVFHPNVENATELRMVIFTRLGHKIFETNKLHVGWDGYFHSGDLAPQGVYIYKVWITYSNGAQEVVSGDVTFLH
jgi:PKD repeat protein